MLIPMKDTMCQKRVIRVFFLTVFCLVCFCFVITAVAGDYYSNSNKTIFVFPEYSSLGGSALVFSRDGTPMSNPANLSLDSSSVVSLAYSGYFDNTFSTTLGSFVTQIRENIGVSMFAGYIYIPDIWNTNGFDVYEDTDTPIFDPSKLKYESSSELFLNFAFGYTIFSTKKIVTAAGAAFHCQRRRLIDWTGYGIGVDVGATLALLKAGVRFSLLFDDITTNYIRWSSDYHDNGLPHARLGIGWHKEIPYIYGTLSIMYKTPDLLGNEGVGYNWIADKAGNITEPEMQSVKEDPQLLLTAGAYGVEYIVQKVVALRVGLDESKRLFFGAGVNLFRRSLFFDFSYMVSNELPGTYSLSMGYHW